MNSMNNYIIETLKILFREYFSEDVIKIEDLKPGASDRTIFRLQSKSHNAVGVHNAHREENRAFIDFSKSFKESGFNVPEIYKQTDDELFYLLEDLGDVTLFDYSADEKDSDKLMSFYKTALEELTRFQIEGAEILDFRLCYQTRTFDKEQIMFDLNKFYEYYYRQFNLRGGITEIKESFIHIADKLNSDSCEYFLYRDFQPRNIMIKNDELYFIDYQSGRLGALQYDAASFLYSGSTKVTEADRNELLEYYLEVLSQKISITRDDFFKDYYYFVLIRLLQMLGSYGYTYLKKKDDKVLAKIPKAFDHLDIIKNEFHDDLIVKFINTIIE